MKGYHYQRTLSKKISLPKMKGQISCRQQIFSYKKKKKKTFFKKESYITQQHIGRGLKDKKKRKKKGQAGCKNKVTAAFQSITMA